jgi:FkbM family methyltransferase
MELKNNNKFIVNNLKYNLGNYIIPPETKNGVAVDIGSNNGCFLNAFKNHFSKIHAYEANYFLVQKLNETFKNINHINIHHKAVSNNDGKILKLLAHKFSDDNGSSSIEKDIENQDWEEFICEVESISLESILKSCNNNIDYMKVDCETSEYEFFINKNLLNIKLIAIELHCQLGREKYTELYNWMCKTHTASENLNFKYGQHQEILFKLK